MAPSSCLSPRPPAALLPPLGGDRLDRHRALLRRVAHDLSDALLPSLTLASSLADTLPAGARRADAEAIVVATLQARELVELLQALSQPGGETVAG